MHKLTLHYVKIVKTEIIPSILCFWYMSSMNAIIMESDTIQIHLFVLFIDLHYFIEQSWPFLQDSLPAICSLK